MEVSNEILLQKPFIKAIEMVRSVYPNLNQVEVTTDGWFFSEDGVFAPSFENTAIDSNVLEEMVDFLYNEVKLPATIKFGHIPNLNNLSVYNIKEGLNALVDAHNILTKTYLHVADDYEDVSKKLEERIQLYNTLLDIIEEDTF